VGDNLRKADQPGGFHSEGDEDSLAKEVAIPFPRRGYPLKASDPYMLCFLSTICR
jgi:hypothetical protein